jgi:hypothetical protein
LKEKKVDDVLPNRDEKSIYNFWSSQIVCHHFDHTAHPHILSFFYRLDFIFLFSSMKKFILPVLVLGAISITGLSVFADTGRVPVTGKSV